MLTSKFIGIDALGAFKDQILVRSLSGESTATLVPENTIAKSYVTYYIMNNQNQYVLPNAQPQAGQPIPANTYYTINAGSPNDVTRAPSVAAIISYLDDQFLEFGNSINLKVSSITYNSNDSKFTYTNGNGVTFDILALEEGNNVSIEYTAGVDSPDYAPPKITISSTDTDTHYTAVPILGETSAKINATTDVTDPYLNIVENNAKSGGIQIKGTGATTVKAKDGIVTINSTDTNTWRPQPDWDATEGDAVIFNKPTDLATQTYVNNQIAAAIGAAIAASY